MPSIKDLKQRLIYKKDESSKTLILVAFLLIFSFLNFQNVMGPQSLFMDEKLIFDGILNILRAENLSILSYAILDGGDQRYGRMLWNLIALFSFVPYQIWGINAIIFVERMVGAISILIAYSILTRIYAKKIISQVIMLLVLLMLPFTIYYATTPKPEPLMLLFLSLYLQRSIKKNEFLGQHWIWLGIVIGLKISGILIVAAICTYIVLNSIRLGTKPKLPNLSNSVACFLIGISIAIPTLYFFGILGLLFYTFYNLRVLKEGINWIRITLIVTLIFSIKPNFESLKNYFAWTIGSAKHGSDSNLVSSLTWISYIFENYLNASLFNLGLGVGLSIVSTLIYRAKNINGFSDLILIGILMFFFTTIPIIFFVERLWGLYLWIGFIFLVCALLDHIIGAFSKTSKILRILIICMALIFSFKTNLFSNFLAEFRSISQIESSDEFRLQEKRYERTIEILTGLSTKTQSKLMVAYDPILWVPRSTNSYQINLFWGPYTKWEEKFDLIVFSPVHTQKEIDYSKSDRIERILEVEGFKKYVRDLNLTCKEEVCYSLFAEYNGVTILKLRTD
jgi:hypothetical protein